MYEGCSNMNASSFIIFVTYMLRQNGMRFYKGLCATFKLAPDLKKNTVFLASYSLLNKGHFSILINSILRTYQWYRRAYNSSINWWNFLIFLRKYPHILIKWFCETVTKIQHVFVKLHRIVFTKVSLCLQINGNQTTTLRFSVKLFSNKIHEATFKLV